MTVCVQLSIRSPTWKPSSHLQKPNLSSSLFRKEFGDQLKDLLSCPYLKDLLTKELLFREQWTKAVRRTRMDHTTRTVITFCLLGALRAPPWCWGWLIIITMPYIHTIYRFSCVCTTLCSHKVRRFINHAAWCGTKKCVRLHHDFVGNC